VSNVDEFANDRTRFYATTRAIEIISKASRHIPDETKASMPGINWRGMAAVGNVYRHGYDQVEQRFVWELVRHNLDQLRGFVVSELRKLGFERH
jgi:uncharacterized protein with HEPN domain